MTTINRAVDAVYAYKFIRLMQKPFTEWSAYKARIIDDRGTVLKRPQTPEEKSAYTAFHASVRSIKRMMTTVPGLAGAASMMSAWSAVASRYDITESQTQEIFTALPLFEDMVAGDSGGSVQNIASGTTTGDIVNKGPETLPSKRKRIKVNLKKL